MEWAAQATTHTVGFHVLSRPRSRRTATGLSVASFRMSSTRDVPTDDKVTTANRPSFRKLADTQSDFIQPSLACIKPVQVANVEKPNHRVLLLEDSIGGCRLIAKITIFLLFFAVYGIDSACTILIRLAKKENIFQAHRTHLYQYLANEKKWSHLKVSALYAVVQAGINLVVILLQQNQWLSNSIIIGFGLVLLVIYGCIRYTIIQSLAHD